VTRLAYALVTSYGMNERIGNLSYSPPQEGSFAHSRPYSELTAEVVDEEARALACRAYERTLGLLSETKELTRQLAQLLLEKEVIHKADVEAVLGERQWKDLDTYDEIVDGIAPAGAEAESR
jgi:ATP-dependent Zn protease